MLADSTGKQVAERIRADIRRQVRSYTKSSIDFAPNVSYARNEEEELAYQ